MLELFRTATSAPVQSVKKSNYDWFNVYDISDIQILNPITMQKESGCKAVEFRYGYSYYLAFVKNSDFLRRTDAMLKSGNIDVLNKSNMHALRTDIADVLWADGETYKVIWVE